MELCTQLRERARWVVDIRADSVGAFFVASLAAFLTIPLPPRDKSEDLLLVLAAGIVTAAAVVLGLVTSRYGPWLRATPAYIFFVAIAMLRQAEGGATSGFGMLVLISLTWLAANSGRTQLWIGIAMMGAVFAAPILLVGMPEYPGSEWRRFVLWLVVGSITAITMQRLILQVRSAAELAEIASRTDALTGLFNRRELFTRLGAEVARAHREKLPLAVAMIDVDHFKSYNDTRGHGAGDDLLRSAASAWSQALRTGDVIARYGGEEFAAVLFCATTDDATVVADRIRTATPGGQTCSIGIAQLAPEESVDAFIARADAALYESKRAGRNRVTAASN